jgi:aspartyl/asparaginyl beta-hydroxylase (cupin superfamily)
VGTSTALQLSSEAQRLASAARERFPARDLVRIEQFFAIARGEQPPPEVEPERAINSRLHVPGLRARPWWDAGGFPIAGALRARFAALREEAVHLLQAPRAFARYPGAVLQGDGITLRGAWCGYYLQRYFRPVREAAEWAPVTLRALDGAQLSREAMISFLSPGAVIEPHSDRINFVITVYLPLVASAGAWIQFGDQRRYFQDGVCSVADSTYYHTSANASPHWRGLLIVDVWHPELTPVERAVLQEAVPALDAVLRAAS